MNKILKTALTLSALMAFVLPAIGGEETPVTRVPEPATAALIACGVGAVALARRYFRKS